MIKASFINFTPMYSPRITKLGSYGNAKMLKNY